MFETKSADGVASIEGIEINSSMESRVGTKNGEIEVFAQLVFWLIGKIPGDITTP